MNPFSSFEVGTVQIKLKTLLSFVPKASLLDSSKPSFLQQLIPGWWPWKPQGSENPKEHPAVAGLWFFPKVKRDLKGISKRFSSLEGHTDINCLWGKELGG